MMKFFKKFKLNQKKNKEIKCVVRIYIHKDRRRMALRSCMQSSLIKHRHNGLIVGISRKN